MGPSLATQIILQSSLKERYELLHVDTKAYDSLDELGKWNLKKVMRNYAIYFRLFVTCLFRRPDLVLVPISQATTGFLKDSVFILLARLTACRVVVQLRGSDFKTWVGKSGGWVRNYVRFILRRTQGVIVLGETLRHVFADYFSPENIYVVPNGANYTLEFRIKNNTPLRLLYLANLQSSKGIEDVIAAIELLKKRGVKNFHLDVVGQWRSESTRDACERRVNEEALPVTFHLPASGQRKMEFLSQADVFIFTPRAPEGHPWVIIEAMAAGLPVISTDRGAIAECILNERNGYIVGIQQPEQIAERLQQLLSDSTLREKMGRQSRALYEEKFTEEKMVERLSQTFETVTAR